MKPGLKVKCIDVSGAGRGEGLVLGKIYEVRCENTGGTEYFLSGLTLCFMKRRFVVVGCQCAIANCIKHRVKK
jgi:hypothetical protein